MLQSNFNRLNISYVRFEKTSEGDFLSVNLDVNYQTNGLNVSEDLIPKIESFNIEERFSALATNTNLRNYIDVHNQTCQKTPIESRIFKNFFNLKKKFRLSYILPGFC